MKNCLDKEINTYEIVGVYLFNNLSDLSWKDLKDHAIEF